MLPLSDNTFLQFASRSCLLVGFALTVACHSSTPTRFVGHRGASHDAPENTLASANLAWRRGADGVEVDVYLTADHHVVCLHDRSTRRTTDKHLLVDQTRYDQLAQLDAGSWKSHDYAGEPIPLLNNLLATIPKGRFMLIEVKSGPEILPYLKTILTNSGKPPRQTRIISFNEKVCRTAKQAMPRVPVYYLSSFKHDESTGQWSPSINQLIKTAHAANLDGLDLHAEGPLNVQTVRRIHAANLETHIWTVDDAQMAQRLINIRVDSITTNRPAWLRSAVC